MNIHKILKFFAICFGLTIIIGIISRIYEETNLGQLRILKNEDKDLNTSSKVLNISDVINSEKVTINQDKINQESQKELMLNTSEFQKFILEAEKIKEKILNFFRIVDKQTFRGKWKKSENLILNENTNTKITNSSIPNNFTFLENRVEGELAFRIERLNSYSITQEKIIIYIRLLDGHFIDKWILIRSINTPFSNITISDTSYTQTLNSYVDLGEIFDPLDMNELEFQGLQQICKSTIHLNWGNSDNSKKDNKTFSEINNITQKNVTHSQPIKEITGLLTSDCGFPDFTFEMEIDNDLDDDSSKVLYYSILVTILAISQIGNTIYLTNKLSDSVTLAKSISLITILENVIWNAYGCLSHFFLTVNFDLYSIQFGLPAFLYFVNFSIFELRLLYNLWRLKNIQYLNDPIILRKKLFQFYFMFYIVMFFSLFYVLKFYFEKPYIYLAIGLTWLPQMIYNMIYKNKMCMPGIYIFLTCLNKVFIPFYARGCSENLFQLKSSSSFILFCLMILMTEIFVLYSQAAMGPRWFIPKRVRLFIWPDGDNEYNFYKTQTEILQIKPGAKIHDCVICLAPLMTAGGENTSQYVDDELIQDNPDSMCDFIAIPVGDQLQVVSTQSSSCRKKIISQIYLTRKRCKENSRMLYDFHECYLDTHHNKPYMITPCNHVFHKPCLESWFKQKKECPSCRKDIDI